MPKATSSPLEGAQASSSASRSRPDTSGQHHTDDSDLEDDPTARHNQADALLLEDPMGDIGTGSAEPYVLISRIVSTVLLTINC